MREIFRRAKVSDFIAIINLYEKAIADLCARQIDQWDALYPDRKTLRSDIRKRQMYILTRDKQIVSAIVLNVCQHELYKTVKWSYGKPAVLHRLCVHPDYQNHGIGRKTVICAEARLRKKNKRSVRLDAFVHNPAALRLYEGLGYTFVGRIYLRKGEFSLYEKSLVDIPAI